MKPTSKTFLIGGHRGIGENLWAGPSVIPALRENTAASLVRAALLGCDFVEFDVQVTRDGVPVIWHDDSIEMMQVYSQGQRQRQRQRMITSTRIADMDLRDFKSAVLPTGNSQLQQQQQQQQLVRHFRGATSRAFLEETLLPWKCASEDELPTLSELFMAVPRHVAFNIEIKVTSIRAPEEIHRMVGAIWNTVQQQQQQQQQEQALVARRQLFFSSFDPDVCETMSTKQSEYDVWFISGCGLYPHVDGRRVDFSRGLEFARANKCKGLVIPASILLAAEGMVGRAAAMGLELRTYGHENDDLSVIEQQRALGVSGVIVDDVEGVMAKLSTLL